MNGFDNQLFTTHRMLLSSRSNFLRRCGGRKTSVEDLDALRFLVNNVYRKLSKEYV